MENFKAESWEEKLQIPYEVRLKNDFSPRGLEGKRGKIAHICVFHAASSDHINTRNAFLAILNKERLMRVGFFSVVTRLDHTFLFLL